MSHIKSYSHPMSMLQFHSRCLQTARSIEPSRSRMWPMQLGSHRNDWKSYETHLQRKEFEGIRYVRYMYSIMYYRQTMKNMYIVWCILYIYCRYSIYIYISICHLSFDRSTLANDHYRTYLSIFEGFENDEYDQNTSSWSESVLGWIPISFILRLCGRQDP